MAELLKGSPVADMLNKKTVKIAESLERQGITPVLAIVRIGEKEDDISYEKSAIKRCEKLGVGVKSMTLLEGCAEEVLVLFLRELNLNDTIHGILLFRPLPSYMHENMIRNLIAPEKDVDGITDSSLAGVLTGSGTGFTPCTAQACMEMLEYYKIDCAGKRAVVVGRSLVAGKPAALLLTAKNATVTLCHTKTVDMPSVCREGDILIACAGKANIIDKNYLHTNQIVIDVGINVSADGLISGDVDFKQATKIVAAITPVPGGIGTVTTAVLINHVAEAALKKSYKLSELK